MGKNWSSPNTRFHEPIRALDYVGCFKKLKCDMAACLNMIEIDRSLRAGNDIPPRFRRGEAPQDQRRRARTQNG
ncbi:uncharacterized protein EV154DRAFT_567279 [Mucor mucedo]|uniref:uncharacterized protein n=1 Tax=Mucor mucedo TaxID=29922 RepID=UPI002221065A|nr:uncharacterized protein EV154DRAFT_567279 [Mucor mucedo]KAI7887679.1 hypothetical protein EV154DRAFT_567279 [Mucor mucedo]